MSSVTKVHITWDNVWEDLNHLVKEIEDSGCVFEFVVGISRGGLVPAAMIARQLHLPLVGMDPTECVQQFGANNVLIVDDIFDTGDTLNHIYEDGGEHQVYCCLYNKNILIDELHMLRKPHFAVDAGTQEWIVFPWESENDDER